MEWKSEGEIPNNELLYRYTNPKAFPEDQTEIPASIFNDPNLSCDWEKYQQEPEKSRHVKEGKTFIIEICVNDNIRFPRNPKRKGEIVEAWKQKIIHDPDEEDDNYSHSLIQGKKKKAVIEAIQEASTIYKKI